MKVTTTEKKTSQAFNAWYTSPTTGQRVAHTYEAINQVYADAEARAWVERTQANPLYIPITVDVTVCRVGADDCWANYLQVTLPARGAQ